MLYLVTVWLHIVAACAWVGGLVFFSAVLVPVLRRQRTPQVRELVAGVGKQFRLVGWGSLALLIVTGVFNVLRRVSLSELATAAFWVSPWGQLLLVKLLLVLTTVVISWLHDRLGAQVSRTDEKSPDFQRQRALSSMLGRALGVVALAVVFVAVLLVRGY